VDGIERTNNTDATINRYSNAQLQLLGVDRVVQEVILYNYDMVGYDFEKSAID
jgi:hypothetical protein